MCTGELPKEIEYVTIYNMSTEHRERADGTYAASWNDILRETERWSEEDRKEFLLLLDKAINRAHLCFEDRERGSRSVDMSRVHETVATEAIVKAMGVYARNQQRVGTVSPEAQHEGVLRVLCDVIGVRLSLQVLKEKHEPVEEDSAPVVDISSEIWRRLRALGVHHPAG